VIVAGAGPDKRGDVLVKGIVHNCDVGYDIKLVNCSLDIAGQTAYTVTMERRAIVKKIRTMVVDRSVILDSLEVYLVFNR
jgi:hypothetical protein